jgi:gluconolactonase
MKLYVTDAAPSSYGGALDLPGQTSSAIYVFDLDDKGFPSNKRLFALAERGITGAIRVDDAGRVWTAERDGIVVRNSQGRLLGLFNAWIHIGQFHEKPTQYFTLAGDTLVILDRDRIWTVRMTKTLLSASMEE